jgi:hypothetical protein
MELSVFKEEAYETYEDLLDRHSLTGMVTVVKLDDAFNSTVFEMWERSAKRASQAGIERWAVVADGIKAISLEGKVKTGDLETMTTEDRSEAVEWVQG